MPLQNNVEEMVAARMAIPKKDYAKDPRSVAFRQSFPSLPIPPTGTVNTETIYMTPATGFDELWQAIIPEMKSRANDVHLPIAAAYAQRLCQAYPEADAELVAVATILHDTGWAHVDKDRIVSEGFRSGDWKSATIRFEHEVQGMIVAQRVLSELGYEQEFIDNVIEIIDGHDTRPVAYSLEDAIVRDADKLWRFDQAGMALTLEWFGWTAAYYFSEQVPGIVNELNTEAAVKIAQADITRNTQLLRTEIIL